MFEQVHAYLQHLQLQMPDIQQIILIDQDNIISMPENINLERFGSYIKITDNILIDLNTTIENVILIQEHRHKIIVLPVKEAWIMICYCDIDTRLGMFVLDLKHATQEIAQFI